MNSNPGPSQYDEARPDYIAARTGSSWRPDGQREAGSRRARFMGVINGIKDSYVQKYADLSSSFSAVDEFDAGVTEAYPDAQIASNGDEEMMLFPSYSRRHPRGNQDTDDPKICQEGDPGAFQPPFQPVQPVQQHWDKYEDRDAVVDIDVRGWVYVPHRGVVTRRQRLVVGIARQLAGLPAPVVPSLAPRQSPNQSSASSPHPLRLHFDQKQDSTERTIIKQETEKLLQQAAQEAEKAERGQYSQDGTAPAGVPRIHQLQSSDSVDSLTMLQKRASWTQIGQMSPEQLAVANSNLMSRLRGFFARPVANSSVTAFFYNDVESRQRTIYTNAYGQFALRAGLDFEPTHVRVLASEKLSATQQVKIIDMAGISVISDIDDTIKHTDMLSGAREAFRNAFLRDLDDLTIDGVDYWYNQLAHAGVQFHYVSNSPWQLFPAIFKFFSGVGLPVGSFHLKQYSGMLQGIFEPVAERKKSTLDRLARDFPHRQFILIGDSGEADLEVYTDFVHDNPGRVLAIYIRDITTPRKHDTSAYFDQNLQSVPPNLHHAPPATTPLDPPPAYQDVVDHYHNDDNDNDPQLKAAIEASLAAFELEEQRRKQPSAFQHESDDLIFFGDHEQTRRLDKIQPAQTPLPQQDHTSSQRVAPPPPPTKPERMRSSALPPAYATRSISAGRQAPLDQPAHYPSLSDSKSDSFVPTLGNDTSFAPLPSRPTGSGTSTNQSYLNFAKTSLTSAYNKLPSAPSWLHDSSPSPKPGPRPNPTWRHPTSATCMSSPSYLPSVVSATAANLGHDHPNTAGPSSLTRAQTNRIELWNKRWLDAEYYLKRHGIELKTWRVGTDLLEDSLRLIERATENKARR